MHIPPDELFPEFSVILGRHDFTERVCFIRVEDRSPESHGKVKSFFKVLVKGFAAELLNYQPEQVKTKVAVQVFTFSPSGDLAICLKMLSLYAELMNILFATLYGYNLLESLLKMFVS